MNQRSALTLAAAITAFVLVVAAGLVSRLSDGAAQAAAQAGPTADTAAYEQALAEANARLEQANAQIAEANRRLAQQPQQPQPAASAYAVTTEQAGAIARAAAGDASATGAAELVRFQGAPAYEVGFGSALIYVDAQSGAVLYNGVAALAGAAPALGGQITPEQAAQAAQAYLGGGGVSSAELREERGAQVYVVAMADGSQVYVDPATGQVVYAELMGGESEEHDHDDGDHDDGDHDDGDHDD